MLVQDIIITFVIVASYTTIKWRTS